MGTNPVAVLKIIPPKLNMVQQDQHIGLSCLVEKTEPRHVLWLVNGDDHQTLTYRSPEACPQVRPNRWFDFRTNKASSESFEASNRLCKGQKCHTLYV